MTKEQWAIVFAIAVAVSGSIHLVADLVNGYGPRIAALEMENQQIALQTQALTTLTEILAHNKSHDPHKARMEALLSECAKK